MKMQKLIINYLFLIIFFIAKNNSSLNANDVFNSAFGNGNGYVTTSVGFLATINSLIVQPDGKIVVGGFTNNTNSQFLLIRYNTDGTLDTSFGNNGIVMTQINSSTSTSQINGVAIEPSDNKIVVAGYSFDNSIATQIILARYNTNGTIDSTYGSNGIVQTSIGSGAQANDIQMQSSNSYAVVTGTAISDNTNIFLARYDTSGVLDPAFGSSGIITPVLAGVTASSASSLVIDNSENLIIGGSSGDGLTSPKFTIARFTSSGTLDTSFGTGGFTTTVIGNFSNGNDLAIDGSGRFILVGFSDSNLAIARYTSTGSLDTTFNSGGSQPGVITASIGQRTVANSVAVDGSGNYLIAGIADNNLFVARYDSSGSLDATFGTNGIVTFTDPNNINNVFANSIAISNSGDDIYTAGGLGSSTLTIDIKENQQDSITITSPTQSAQLSQNIITISGISTAASETVKIYIDGILFQTVSTDGSGNWESKLSSPLSSGSHTLRADLIVSAIVIASHTNVITIKNNFFNTSVSGSTIKVDSVYGSDSTGMRNGSPFKTINAALAVAQSGDVVWLTPGTYAESITIPTSVLIRGISPSTCSISLTNVTSATDLVTMGENSSIQEVSLNLTTSTAGTQIRGVVFPGTTSATATINKCAITVNSSGAGSGNTANTYGIHSTGTGQAILANQAVVNSVVFAVSAGSGNCRGLLVDAANKFNALLAVFSAARTTGTGTAIGVETNNASANVIASYCLIKGNPTSDISQTLGSITLTNTTLETISANGNPFTSFIYPKNYIFADSGTITQNATTYLRIGTATASSTEIQVRVSQAMLVKALAVNLQTAPGTGNSVTWTVRKNGSNTPITLTISDTSTSGVFNTASVAFAAGDLISIQQVASTTNSAADVVAVVDFF